jgi:hypothetical protein
MKNILNEARKLFQDVNALLNSKETRNNAYFTKLSIATEEAYFTMNSGMCASSSVCHECASHRDFIRDIMEIIGALEVDSTAANLYNDKLAEYSERVNKILKNIASALAS